jgi:transposase
MQVTTVGLDLAKNIFHVHGVTAEGDIIFNRALRRSQVLAFFDKLAPCLVGMEACGTSHHWGRELRKLGHQVRLIPPIYVKPYVKRGKSDAADAAAICEAVGRPTMRFVAIKSEEQQGLLCLHRTRELIVRQRTQTVNALRSLLAEFGHIAAKSIHKATALARDIVRGEGPDLPATAEAAIGVLCQQFLELDVRARGLARQIAAAARSDDRIRLLQTIPGVGPITASAIVATVGTPDQFRNGRDFAAWLGLTPLNRSTGGRERLGHISKMGDRYLRRLLVTGMTARVRIERAKPERADPWVVSLLERKPVRLVTVAMANKTARIIWAMLTRNEVYRPAAT